MANIVVKGSREMFSRGELMIDSDTGSYPRSMVFRLAPPDGAKNVFIKNIEFDSEFQNVGMNNNCLQFLRVVNREADELSIAPLQYVEGMSSGYYQLVNLWIPPGQYTVESAVEKIADTFRESVKSLFNMEQIRYPGFRNIPYDGSGAVTAGEISNPNLRDGWYTVKKLSYMDEYGATHELTSGQIYIEDFSQTMLDVSLTGLEFAGNKYNNYIGEYSENHIVNTELVTINGGNQLTEFSVSNMNCYVAYQGKFVGVTHVHSGTFADYRPTSCTITSAMATVYVSAGMARCVVTLSRPEKLTDSATNSGWTFYTEFSTSAADGLYTGLVNGSLTSSNRLTLSSVDGWFTFSGTLTSQTIAGLASGTLDTGVLTGVDVKSSDEPYTYDEIHLRDNTELLSDQYMYTLIKHVINGRKLVWLENEHIVFAVDILPVKYQGMVTQVTKILDIGPAPELGRVRCNKLPTVLVKHGSEVIPTNSYSRLSEYFLASNEIIDYYSKFCFDGSLWDLLGIVPLIIENTSPKINRNGNIDIVTNRPIERCWLIKGTNYCEEYYTGHVWTQMIYRTTYRDYTLKIDKGVDIFANISILVTRELRRVINANIEPSTNLYVNISANEDIEQHTNVNTLSSLTLNAIKHDGLLGTININQSFNVHDNSYYVTVVSDESRYPLKTISGKIHIEWI